MIEQALFVHTPDNLHYLTDDFTRLYFGQEFCERRVPSPDDLQRALERAVAGGMGFTLVTPYVTNPGLERVARLLEIVAGAGIPAEVVFNDWGVYQCASEIAPELRLVLGRLLNKSKRGPRIMNIIDQIPEASRRYFRGSSLDVPAACRFLKERSIDRVEFDNILQGLDFSGADPELHRSLYIPFVFVSTTRFCLVANCDSPAGDRPVGVTPCAQECRRYAFQLYNPVMGLPLIRQGNTLFYCNEKISEVVSSHQVDRIVVQPEIPL